MRTLAACCLRALLRHSWQGALEETLSETDRVRTHEGMSLPVIADHTNYGGSNNVAVDGKKNASPAAQAAAAS